MKRTTPEQIEVEQDRRGILFKQLKETEGWKELEEWRDRAKERFVDMLTLGKISEINWDGIPRGYFVRGMINGLDQIFAEVEGTILMHETNRKRREKESETLG